ncbi:hypothetical protein M885DRAFT_549134 [Pelagophyceae sp. CCMP2097]|nr:hypothetical protein M885DRAFT_549134 [Pelagophyceae sp. CCMP2097]
MARQSARGVHADGPLDAVGPRPLARAASSTTSTTRHLRASQTSASASATRWCGAPSLTKSTRSWCDGPSASRTASAFALASRSSETPTWSKSAGARANAASAATARATAAAAAASPSPPSSPSKPSRRSAADRHAFSGRVVAHAASQASRPTPRASARFSRSDSTSTAPRSRSSAAADARRAARSAASTRCTDTNASPPASDTACANATTSRTVMRAPRLSGSPRSVNAVDGRRSPRETFFTGPVSTSPRARAASASTSASSSASGAGAGETMPQASSATRMSSMFRSTSRTRRGKASRPSAVPARRALRAVAWICKARAGTVHFMVSRYDWSRSAAAPCQATASAAPPAPGAPHSSTAPSSRARAHASRSASTVDASASPPSAKRSTASASSSAAAAARRGRPAASACDSYSVKKPSAMAARRTAPPSSASDATQTSADVPSRASAAPRRRKTSAPKASGSATLAAWRAALRAPSKARASNMPSVNTSLRAVVLTGNDVTYAAKSAARASAVGAAGNCGGAGRFDVADRKSASTPPSPASSGAASGRSPWVRQRRSASRKRAAGSASSVCESRAWSKSWATRHFFESRSASTASAAAEIASKSGAAGNAATRSTAFETASGPQPSTQRLRKSASTRRSGGAPGESALARAARSSTGDTTPAAVVAVAASHASIATLRLVPAGASAAADSPSSTDALAADPATRRRATAAQALCSRWLSTATRSRTTLRAKCDRRSSGASKSQRVSRSTSLQSPLSISPPLSRDASAITSSTLGAATSADQSATVVRACWRCVPFPKLASASRRSRRALLGRVRALQVHAHEPVVRRQARRELLAALVAQRVCRDVEDEEAQLRDGGRHGRKERALCAKREAAAGACQRAALRPRHRNAGSRVSVLVVAPEVARPRGLVAPRAVRADDGHHRGRRLLRQPAVMEREVADMRRLDGRPERRNENVVAEAHVLQRQRLEARRRDASAKRSRRRRAEARHVRQLEPDEARALRAQGQRHGAHQPRQRAVLLHAARVCGIAAVAGAAARHALEERRLRRVVGGGLAQLRKSAEAARAREVAAQHA